MELIFTKPDKARFMQIYEETLKEAFPPAELKPLSLLEAMTERGEYEPIEIFKNGTPAGYFLLWWHQSRKCVLIDYFCVPKKRRNSGIGGKLLDTLLDRYADKIVIAESEAPVGDAVRDDIINRRLGFYARHGARVMNYDCEQFGIKFKCLRWADQSVTDKEIMQYHYEIYKASLPQEMFDKSIKIPL